MRTRQRKPNASTRLLSCLVVVGVSVGMGVLPGPVEARDHHPGKVTKPTVKPVKPASKTAKKPASGTAKPTTTKPTTAKPATTLATPTTTTIGTRSVDVPTGELTEASGCAVSTSDPTTVWLHNDSGNDPVLFAYDIATSKVRSVPVSNAKMIDWEDIAPLPGGGVVIGDIGDNDSKRESVQLYRITDLTTTPLNAVPEELRYEDGAHNAEALVVDPASSPTNPDVYVITKEPTGNSAVYRAEAGVLKKVASVAVTGEALIFPNQITAADALPGGAGIILRTYQYAYVYRKQPSQPFVAAFSAKPTRVSMPFLAQAEALCVLANGSTALTTTESRGSASIPFVFLPIP